MMLYDFNPYWIMIFALLAIGVIALAAVLICRSLKKKSKHLESNTEQNQSEITKNESRESAENQPNQKMMSFGQAIKTCFKKYFSFQGCATRAEYWWFHLFVIVVNLIFLGLIRIMTVNEWLGADFVLIVLMVLFEFAVILPISSVGVRRMHDTGNPGFFIVIPIVSLINLFIPTNKESEYRSEYNIHPTRNMLGKIVVILAYVYYIFFMVKWTHFMYALLQIQKAQASSYYEEEDDVSQSDGDSLWWEDGTNDNSETVKDVRDAVHYFFEDSEQEYEELEDEENGDLYFWGERDLFIYPTLENGLSYEHYVFGGDFSSLDDFDLDDDMDFRSFENSPYTALKSGKSIMLRKESGNYSNFTFKETLSLR